MAACVVMWCADAVAQTAINTDPLAPKLQTDPRNPPHFQKFSRPALVQLGPPATFTAPASGAGKTGFDSTNSRKKISGKAKAKPNAKPNDKSPADAQAIAPGLPAPTVVSRYQKPPNDSLGGVYAQAPGAPPVELGPIRRPPKTHKAHTEPDDPY